MHGPENKPATCESFFCGQDLQHSPLHVGHAKHFEAFQVHPHDNNVNILGPDVFASTLSRPNSRVDDRSMSVESLE